MTPKRINWPPARAAVSSLFFINGMMIGAWAPMIPLFKQRLGLTESEIGMVILALGIGSIVSMPIIGAFIAKKGTRLPVIYLTLLSSCGLLLLASTPSFLAALAIMLAFGAAWAGMDVSMNANVIEVEHQRGFPIMSSCHGFWSLGGLSGAFFGGFTLLAFSELGHGLFWMLIFLAIALVALKQVETTRVIIAPDGEKISLHMPRSTLPYLLGAIALFSVIPEGVVLDWSALFLNEERDFDLTFAGMGFAATSTAMAIMRFLGDSIRQKHGSVVTLRISVIIAILGFLILALSTSQLTIIAGFFIAGLGMANLFPIAVSAAGNLPGIPSGIAVSIVTSIGYGGILLAPPLFGVIAQHWDYELIFLIVPFSLAAVWPVLKTARYADIPPKR